MELILILVLIMILGCLAGYLGEKKAYHGGRCPKCWGVLRYFDTDSQGGRGYTCENRDYYIWVSWPGIVSK